MFELIEVNVKVAYPTWSPEVLDSQREEFGCLPMYAALNCTRMQRLPVKCRNVTLIQLPVFGTNVIQCFLEYKVLFFQHIDG